MLRVRQFVAVKFGFVVLRAGLFISMLRFLYSELVFSLKSGLVTLLTRDDLEVIAWFWRLLGNVHFNIVGQKIVTICMSIWV